MLSTMSSYLVPVLLVVLYCHYGLAASYNEKCSVGVTSDNKTLDDCERDRNLVCLQSRCVCQDQANQIWSARLVKVNSRTKRGSKSKGKGGGFGKTLLVGAAAGAAGGYLGGKLAQGGPTGSGDSSSGGGGSKRKEQYQSYYACHSRVGGQCVLDAYRDVIVTINKPAEAQSAPNTTTTSTTVAPAVANNETTTPTTTTAVPVPVAAAQTSQITYDVSRMTVPKCVEYAMCKTTTVKIVNGTVISPVSDDPRLGSCECKDGYKANNLDICVKVNGAGVQSQISFFALFTTLLVSFYAKY